MNPFLLRATNIRDFRDPDNDPGMSELMHEAHQNLRQRELKSAPIWTNICKEVGGSDLRIFESTLSIDRSKRVQFKFPGGSVGMFNSDVYLRSDRPFTQEVKAALQKIWKDCGVPLGARGFLQIGNSPAQNGLELGYFGSLALPKGRQTISAILLSIDLLKKFNAANP